MKIIARAPSGRVATRACRGAPRKTLYDLSVWSPSTSPAGVQYPIRSLNQNSVSFPTFPLITPDKWSRRRKRRSSGNDVRQDPQGQRRNCGLGVSASRSRQDDRNTGPDRKRPRIGGIWARSAPNCCSCSPRSRLRTRCRDSSRAGGTPTMPLPTGAENPSLARSTNRKPIRTDSVCSQTPDRGDAPLADYPDDEFEEVLSVNPRSVLDVKRVLPR